jgi:hypothetical protein
VTHEWRTEAMEEIARLNDLVELRANERDALKAKLTKIGGLLDYWGNSGKEDYCGKLFRAIEVELER